MTPALHPDVLMKWLDFSLPRLLIGKKEVDPTFWRVLGNIKQGRQQRVHPKTEAKLLRLLQEKTGNPDILALIESTPATSPWAIFAHSLAAGYQAGCGLQFKAFTTEAIRLEQMAMPVKKAVEQGDLSGGRDLLAKLDMPWLFHPQRMIERINCAGTREDFAKTAMPLVVATTLYLLACAEADCDESNPVGECLLPEMRGGVLIRPMRRWLEALKEAGGLKTQRSLAQAMLVGQDEDTSRREVRKWWSGREIPAWSRVPTMAHAISIATQRDDIEEIARVISNGLAAVRLLDTLFIFSVAAQNHGLPDYDPLEPFRNYSAMLAHARKIKVGLSA